MENNEYRREKKFLNSEEVTDEYGISSRLLITLRHKRKIQYTKIGKNCVYKREWIEEYIERNVVKAAV